MKSYLLLFLVVPLVNTNYFKNVDGYIVSSSGDTSAARIKMPGLMGYNFNKQVQIIDSTGGVQTLLPTDIKGFGYTNNEKQYIYYSKPIKDGKMYFLEPVVTGPRASLYQYVVTAGQYGSNQEFYTFENAAGDHMFMTNYAALDVFRQKLKEFYKEYPGIQQLIDTKFNTRRGIQRDIRSIVEAVNKLP
jgi:hypothetical protein